MKTTILVLIGSLFCDAVFACSFARAKYFPPQNPLIVARGEKPKVPKVEFKVKRGYLNNIDSCSDTGVITIEIPAQGYASYSTGYLFEVVSSSEAQTIFPDLAIYSNAKSITGVNRYSFPWVDGGSNVQEPLKVVVNIYRIGVNWVLSDPTKLEINHRGRI